MGEKLSKTRQRLLHARDTLIENTRKNIVLIFIGIYLIVITLWNTTTLLAVGDISIRLYFILLVDGFNTPIFIITSLILTGKWKTTIFDKEAQIKIVQLERMIDLANQEIENLKLIQELNHTIGDLTQALQKQKDDLKKQMNYERQVAEYRTQLAAVKGKVPDVACRVKDWNDANKIIEVIEKEIKKNEIKEEVNENAGEQV